MTKLNGGIAVTDEVTESEVATVLRRLAGRNSRAVWVADRGSGLISSCGDDGQACRGGGGFRIEAAVWQRLLDGGLVVPDRENDNADDVWRISNAGRIHLRRLLSRSQSQTVEGDGPRASAQRSSGVERALSAPSESPLAWLARRRDKSGRPLIAVDEFHAGERLRADFTLGQMMEKVTSSWSPLTGFSKRGSQLDGELTMSEAALDARERVRAALADVGPELSGVLIDVCCFLKGLEATERAAGWPQRSGKLILQMALRALARHYKTQRQCHRADAA